MYKKILICLSLAIQESTNTIQGDIYCVLGCLVTFGANMSEPHTCQMASPVIYNLWSMIYVCLVRHSVNKCPCVLIDWTASILQCIIKLAPHSSSYNLLDKDINQSLTARYRHIVVIGAGWVRWGVEPTLEDHQIRWGWTAHTTKHCRIEVNAKPVYVVFKYHMCTQHVHIMEDNTFFAHT